MTKKPKHMALDLRAMARRAMIENGFAPEMPPGVASELQALESNPPDDLNDPSIRDLRSVLWSSIDNSDSRDLDQIEFAERLPDNDIRLLIGIADVDAFVP